MITITSKQSLEIQASGIRDLIWGNDWSSVTGLGSKKMRSKLEVWTIYVHKESEQDLSFVTSLKPYMHPVWRWISFTWQPPELRSDIKCRMRGRQLVRADYKSSSSANQWSVELFLRVAMNVQGSRWRALRKWGKSQGIEGRGKQMRKKTQW